MVTINISNKAVYLIIGILVVVLLAGLGIAIWDSPSVSHDSDEVKVTLDGTDYNLQEAIDGGLIGGVGSCELLEQTSKEFNSYKVVNIPEYCKSGNVCYVLLKAKGPVDSLRRTRGTLYTQDSEGYFNWILGTEKGGTHNDAINGDVGVAWYLAIANNIGVFDDWYGEETSKDSWVLRDYLADWEFEVYACPIFNFT